MSRRNGYLRCFHLSMMPAHAISNRSGKRIFRFKVRKTRKRRRRRRRTIWRRMSEQRENEIEGTNLQVSWNPPTHVRPDWNWKHVPRCKIWAKKAKKKRKERNLHHRLFLFHFSILEFRAYVLRSMPIGPKGTIWREREEKNKKRFFSLLFRCSEHSIAEKL